MVEGPEQRSSGTGGNKVDALQSVIVFRKVLIANRGEIALRVIRTLREMGIRSVAVYSDADRAALHVRKADEAAHLGPSPSRESYLNIDRILDAARRARRGGDSSGLWLSQRERGVRRRRARTRASCSSGRRRSRSRRMGSKTAARRMAIAGGAPVVPGTEEGLTSSTEARRVCAASAGFPVMLKAVAGGGGKGHAARGSRGRSGRRAFESASSEALRAFGDGRIYVEKLIENARHIEIQMLGDRHGNMVHLGERECSVQRRHQKVIEESPSPLVAGSRGCESAWARPRSRRRARPDITTRARSSFWG